MNNQKKDNNNLKTKKQLELTENRTVWKSNNQGDKEETFIQTGRRGRDGQLGWRGLTARQWMADPVRWLQLADPTRWWLADPAAPHLHIDKPGGTAGEPSRPWNPGPQRGEIKPQTTDWKHLWGLRLQWEKLPASQESSLEGHTGA